MGLVEKAYLELYAEDCPYGCSVKYSRAFKGYNANVRFDRKNLAFRLSHNWKTVSLDIRIGLIQSLLNRLFKTKNESLNIDFYNLFLKNVHISVPVTKTHEYLKGSFDRVNEKYFYGMLDTPNLVMGQKNISKLGSYDYGSDTIMISSILLEEPDLLDYVMFHEMIHKKLKFKEKNGKTYHHTSEFRKLENTYEIKDAEKRLEVFLKKKRMKGFLKGFFS